MNGTRRSGSHCMLWWTLWANLATQVNSGELIQGRPSLVFQNEVARLVVDLSGGSIGEFRLRDNSVNPLHWGSPTPGDTGIHGFGHFLCLDRWGPPSAAEGARGMPYHGEAASVAWTSSDDPAERSGAREARLSAKLPKAGLSVERTIRFSLQASAFSVREEITNENPLGRIYNIVQHPTIGPPFLDETTVVDCNGRRGFAQGGSLPVPEEPSFYWPRAVNRDGDSINLRRLTSDANPDVVTYALDDTLGWVTATTPGKGLLIGYVWKTVDYPWVSLWRSVRDGKPAARGLEFGSTGLHQPFPVLVQKGRIWDRPLFEYLDAGETRAKSYVAFLCAVPHDFAGVESIGISQGRLLLRERAGGKPRELRVDLSGVWPE